MSLNYYASAPLAPAASFALRRVGCRLATFALLGGALLASYGAHAQVAYATSGSGQYKNSIAWLTWGGGTRGTNGVVLAPGTTNTATIRVGTNSLVVTTTISGFANGDLTSYRSGSFKGDALDDAYNIGGSGGNNTLVNGLINRVGGALVPFTLTLSATVNGVPLDIPSVVLADAEATGNGEYVEAGANGQWSAVEVEASCSNPYNAAVRAGTGISILRLTSPNGACGLYGPAGIVSLAFNPSAYAGTNRQVSVNANIKGGGSNALAIGLILPFDYGDAPASSYGYATHFIPQIFNRQLATGSNTNIDAGNYTFATITAPKLLLGSLVDADNNNFVGSAAYNQDDNNFGAGGANDEDGVTYAPLAVTRPDLVQPIASYSVTTSVRNITGQDANLVGWIDWDNNGTFDPSEAAVASVPSDTNGNQDVVLTWTNQTLSGASGQKGIPARFRLTSDALTASTPSGAASDGEVEDYFIPFNQPLPVTLVSFVGQATKTCDVALSWRTASEQNSARYEVERSLDGSHFTQVSTVLSRNSSTGAAYGYVDKAAGGGLHYYRLKSVDFDGTSTYSPVASVNSSCGAGTSITLSPNPTTGNVTIGGLQAGQQLRVYSADGRLLHTTSAQEGTQQLAIGAWPAGLYLVHVRQADGSLLTTQKLLKQ